MDEREVINHLMDIKERISVVETKVDSVMINGATTARRLEVVEDEQIKAKATLKTLRWIGGALLVTVPATAAAIVKIFNP